MSTITANALDSSRPSDRQNTYVPITARTTIRRTAVKSTQKATKCCGANLLTRPSPIIHVSPRIMNNNAQQTKLVNDGMMHYPIRRYPFGLSSMRGPP